MVMTDNILFVKEAKTCSYVLVVQTPRLCGEPGFKSRRDTGEEAEIRCREVVDAKMEREINLPTADHPLKIPPRKTVLPAPPTTPKKDLTGQEKVFNEFLRKTLEAIMDSQQNGDENGLGGEDGEVILQLAENMEDIPVESGRLIDALRAAGYDVQTEIITVGNDKEEKKQQSPPAKKQPSKGQPHRDEL
jgi:protein OS-9